MEKIRDAVTHVFSALTWARAHKAVVLAGTVAVLHAVAVVWTDVPSEMVTNVVRALLGA